jgi:hypothetical protein
MDAPETESKGRHSSSLRESVKAYPARAFFIFFIF